jgi:hypothetical protein
MLEGSLLQDQEERRKKQSQRVLYHTDSSIYCSTHLTFHNLMTLWNRDRNLLQSKPHYKNLLDLAWFLMLLKTKKLSDLFPIYPYRNLPKEYQGIHLQVCEET